MSESAFDSEMYKRIRGSSAWSPFTMSPSELVTRAFSQQFSLRFNIVGVHVCDNYSVRCFHGYRHRYNGGGGGGKQRVPKSWCIFEKLLHYSKVVLQEVLSIRCWRRGSWALSVVIHTATKVSAVCKSVTKLATCSVKDGYVKCASLHWASLPTWWWTWDSASLRIEENRTLTDSLLSNLSPWSCWLLQTWRPVSKHCEYELEGVLVGSLSIGAMMQWCKMGAQNHKCMQHWHLGTECLYYSWVRYAGVILVSILKWTPLLDDSVCGSVRIKKQTP